MLDRDIVERELHKNAAVEGSAVQETVMMAVTGYLQAAFICEVSGQAADASDYKWQQQLSLACQLMQHGKSAAVAATGHHRLQLCTCKNNPDP
jgi:hypothetical protein